MCLAIFFAQRHTLKYPAGSLANGSKLYSSKKQV